MTKLHSTYSTPPIVRGSIVRDPPAPPRVRGFLFKTISSHFLKVKFKKVDFTSLRNLIVMLNHQPVA
jgi:hypothetical protein